MNRGKGAKVQRGALGSVPPVRSGTLSWLLGDWSFLPRIPQAEPSLDRAALGSNSSGQQICCHLVQPREIQEACPASLGSTPSDL